jgi:hypothetical protein
MIALPNPLRLSEEQLTQVHELSGCNYSPEKIALYLDVSKEEFLREWYNKQSDVRLYYDRGQLLSEFIINNKQRELAESGNITAAQIFLKESEKNKIENIRNHCFFGK